MILRIYSLKMNKQRERSLKYNFNNRRGFTLIELIVVIAIFGIILNIAFPKFSGLIQSSKFKADKATVVALNKATSMLRMTTLIGDLFADEKIESEDLLEELVGKGYLSSDVEVQTKGAKIEWLHDKEKWHLTFEDFFM